MGKIVIVVIFSSLLQNTLAQTTDSLFVSKSEIKAFFSDTRSSISKKSVFRLADKPNEVPSRQLLEKILTRDTLLIKADIEFILEQSNQTKKLQWDNTLIDSTDFIKNKSIDSIFEKFKVVNGWQVFHKKFGADFYRLSIPYFTIDRQVCFIYISNHCGGLCGYGNLRVYKRQKNGWFLFKTIGGWVS